MYTSKLFSFIAGVVDTADKHSFEIFETILMGFSKKKPEVANLVSDTGEELLQVSLTPMRDLNCEYISRDFLKLKWKYHNQGAEVNGFLKKK
jgi:hypothetical protein